MIDEKPSPQKIKEFEEVSGKFLQLCIEKKFTYADILAIVDNLQYNIEELLKNEVRSE